MWQRWSRDPGSHRCFPERNDIRGRLIDQENQKFFSMTECIGETHRFGPSEYDIKRESSYAENFHVLLWEFIFACFSS